MGHDKIGPREQQLREMREARALRAEAAAKAAKVKADEYVKDQDRRFTKATRKTDKRQNPSARAAQRGSTKAKRKQRNG